VSHTAVTLSLFEATSEPWQVVGPHEAQDWNSYVRPGTTRTNNPGVIRKRRGFRILGSFRSDEDKESRCPPEPKNFATISSEQDAGEVLCP
jgi:hypothetical protein